jgi:type II secretory ATPase GspE/PulE/Tfp pilus assembly ATPase PilB-like protein
MKYRFICNHCGSSNVAHDARAVWNEKEQKWEIETLYDSADCDDCQGETKLKKIEIVK